MLWASTRRHNSPNWTYTLLADNWLPNLRLSWLNNDSTCQRCPYCFFGNRFAIRLRQWLLGPVRVGRPRQGGMTLLPPNSSRTSTCARSLS